MTVAPVTTSFMKALPAALRPNPYSVDEYVMRAVENGWDTDELAKLCYINDRSPNPAFVVTNVRRLCELGPQRQPKRTGWDYGHLRCDDQWHPPECELCRCVPGVLTHHVPSPASKPLPKIGRTVE